MYKNFSYLYDQFMYDIPYDEWVSNILTIFLENDFNPKTIVDLGCGTGELTSKLQSMGFNMIGIDISEDMIKVAKKKNTTRGQNIIYKTENIVDFTLDKKVDSMISTCDSYNYILDDNDLLKSFKKVYSYLNDDGMFIFDMNTEYYFKNILGNSMYSDINSKNAYIVENTFDCEQNINTYKLNLFIENEKGSYDKNIEIHKEKARNPKDVIKLLNLANFKFLCLLDTYDLNIADDKSLRIYFVCIK